MRVFERGKESPMDWEGEGAAAEPLPPWASGQKRRIQDVKDSARSSAFEFGATGPVYSDAPFLFSMPPSHDGETSLLDTEMADASQERSLVLSEGPSRSTAQDRDRAGESKTTSPDAGDVAHSQECEEDEESDVTPVKHRGSDDGIKTDARKPRLFAKGAVSRVRRRRGSQRLSHMSRPGQRRREARERAEEASEGETEDGAHSLWAGSRAVNYFLPPAVTKQELSHLDWPEILLGYAQFAFNASLLAAFLYMLYCVASTIAQDVRDKVHESSFDAVSEVQMCAEKFRLNRCGTDGAVPALDSACKAWARCMARDPTVVGKARVAAETFAEILNGFVDVISWKSMLFCLAILTIIVHAANSTLTFFRSQSRKRRQKREERAARHETPGTAGVGHFPGHHPHSILPPYAYPPASYAQNGYWNHKSSPPPTPASKRRFFGPKVDAFTEDSMDSDADSFALQ